MVRFSNGAVYSGHLKESKRDGKGTQIWADGSKYCGDWKDNAAEGFGKF
jgi:hypothetical protein